MPRKICNIEFRRSLGRNYTFCEPIVESVREKSSKNKGAPVCYHTEAFRHVLPV